MKLIYTPNENTIILGGKTWCIIFYYYLRFITYWNYNIQIRKHSDYKYLFHLTTPIFSISFFQKYSI